MENSALDAQMEIAGQELKATQTGLARLSRESLATPEKKSDLTAYEGEIEAKRIQYEFAQNMRQRSEIVATRDGTAVFADLHQLEGKPMGTGEKIMMIADQENYDLLVRIPADAMIPLASDDKISFYLNVSPLSGYTASIRSIGYQASVDADGLFDLQGLRHSRRREGSAHRLEGHSQHQIRLGHFILCRSTPTFSQPAPRDGVIRWPGRISRFRASIRS